MTTAFRALASGTLLFGLTSASLAASLAQVGSAFGPRRAVPHRHPRATGQPSPFPGVPGLPPRFGGNANRDVRQDSSPALPSWLPPHVHVPDLRTPEAGENATDLGPRGRPFPAAEPGFRMPMTDSAAVRSALPVEEALARTRLGAWLKGLGAGLLALLAALGRILMGNRKAS